jgi:hypothetical protein
MCNNLIRDCDFITDYFIHREGDPVSVETRTKEVCSCNNKAAFLYGTLWFVPSVDI